MKLLLMAILSGFIIGLFSEIRNEISVVLASLILDYSLAKNQKILLKILIVSICVTSFYGTKKRIKNHFDTKYGFDPLLPPPPYTEHKKLFTPASWDILSVSLAKTSTTGVPYELELETVKENSRNGWMWIQGEAVFNTNNEIVGIRGAAQDISIRKQEQDELLSTKEKIEESEAWLIEAQAVAKIESWETDLSSSNVSWSEETFRIFDIKSTDFEASHSAFLGFAHPEDRKDVDDAIMDSLSTKLYNSFEHRIITSTGQLKHIEERWRIIINSENQPIKAVRTCQDITERKKEEILRIEINKEL